MGSETALTGIVRLMTVLLSFMESVVLLLLIDLGLGDGLLISGLIDLGVPDVGSSTHFDARGNF